MAQLGKALTILLAAHQQEFEMHEDIAIMHAPSECHRDVARGEGRRLRLARRHALHVAGFRRLSQLRRAVRKQLGNDGPIYKRFGFVPY